ETSQQKILQLASTDEDQRASRYLSLLLAQRVLKNRQASQSSLQGSLSDQACS
ncbi:hypothetical protein A2U01_0106002, partial [Trifolium medium]|nr:hypothetical protein [Trifolium medium]